MLEYSESTNDLVPALLAVQQETPTIEKTAQGQAGKGKFYYAPLPAVLAAMRPLWNKHGLIVNQGMGQLDVLSHIAVITHVTHLSGQWVRSSIVVPCGNTPQQLGAACTYGRRYGLDALFSLSLDTDLDAQGFGAAERKQRQRGGVVPLTDEQESHMADYASAIGEAETVSDVRLRYREGKVWAQANITANSAMEAFMAELGRAGKARTAQLGGE